jgi:signal transduction histidine kinase
LNARPAGFFAELRVGLLTAVALAAAVILFAALLLNPSRSQALQLGAFLLLSGGLSVAGVLVMLRSRRFRLLPSFRAKLLSILVVTAVLMLANVGFTAYLMFLSTHDLKLLSLLLLFSLGIAAFFGLRVAAAFHSMLRELVAGVQAMGAGRLGTRISLDSGDELSALAESFNTMAAQLDSAFERQKEMERARRDLIAAVSHDLRTPLATIRAMVESLQDGVVSDRETVERYLGTIQTEVGYLSRLIDDLFELSQIDSGLLELHLEPAHIADLISDTLEALSPHAGLKKLTLLGEVDAGIPPLVMDTARMQRVLYNLVQNAVSHTPADGTVTIRAVNAGETVELSVIDTGDGIDAEDVPRIFERFYRGGSKARPRNDSGSGLGLSIAKGIVELHGGRIWALSESGQGTIFTCALPLSGRSWP